jgi:oxygen-independent coproporphyrinogen-3 oxidase
VDKDAYAQAVCKEIENKAKRFGQQTIDTIYFGGGTPTLMSTLQIKKIMHMVRGSFDVTADAEITMEGNPETINVRYLEEVQAVGINRLSMGVQSLQDKQLQIIGRIHTADRALMAIQAAVDAGLKNISVDLMLGLPEQTAKAVESDIKKLVNTPIKHLSAYELKLESGTPLKKQVENAEIVLPDEDEMVRIDTVVRRQLAEQGFQRYEISNYAKPNYQSKHNLKYWHNEEYLGIGCSAHSRMQNKRFANTNNLKQYIANSHNAESMTFMETISQDQAVVETIMLGLRLTEGLNTQHVYEKLGINLLKQFDAPIQRLISQKLMVLTDKQLTLTERGMDFQNTVLMEFMK